MKFTEDQKKKFGKGVIESLYGALSEIQGNLELRKRNIERIMLIDSVKLTNTDQKILANLHSYYHDNIIDCKKQLSNM